MIVFTSQEHRDNNLIGCSWPRSILSAENVHINRASAALAVGYHVRAIVPFQPVEIRGQSWVLFLLPVWWWNLLCFLLDLARIYLCCSVYCIQVDACVSQPPRSCVTLALQQTTFLRHFHFCRKLLPSVPVCLKVLLQFAARANSLTFNLYVYLCIYLFAHV